jgi:hypothetical protein
MAWHGNEWGCTHQMLREAPDTALGVSVGNNKPLVPSSHRGLNLIGSVWELAASQAAASTDRTCR